MTIHRAQGLSRLGLFLLLPACVVGPDYEPPRPDLPSAFTAEVERGLASGDVGEGRWWEDLGDPVLIELLDEALAGNLDLVMALSRISEARALRGIRATDWRPTVDAFAGYERRRNSALTPQGAFVPRRNDAYSLGLDARWEPDLWGRVRHAVEAAEAELDATVEDLRAVLVSLRAEVALAYVELRQNQQRAAIARANLEIQAQTLAVTQNQFKANLVSQLDVAQARSLLESTRATLPPLEAAARVARNRLAVLLGRLPGVLEERLATPGPIPAPPASIAVGLPAELLTRRPDVRRAERGLAAQTARVGVATAELYPNLSLGADLGLLSQRSSDLFRRDAANYGIGTNLLWTVFDRERLTGAVDVQDQRLAQAMASYELTVLLALEEVENAMTRFVRGRQRHESLGLSAAEARRAVELSRDRYRQGLVSFQSVLDSQGRLFALEDGVAVNEAVIVSELITLYRALGGGWSEEQDPSDKTQPRAADRAQATDAAEPTDGDTP